MRNKEVDLCRLICSLFVVSIHTDLMIEFQGVYIFAQTIARTAVPFFLTVSGFYFCRAISHRTGKENETYIKYIKNLLRAYLVASSPYAAKWMIQNMTVGRGDNAVICAIWDGFSGHLWYFPASILGITILYLILVKCRILDRKVLLFLFAGNCYLICSVGSIYYHIIPHWIGVDELFESSFYIRFLRRVLYVIAYLFLGAALQRSIDKLTGGVRGKKQLCATIVLLSVVLIVEEYLTCLYGLNEEITWAFFYFPLLAVICSSLFGHQFSFARKISLDARNAAGFTYYYHILVTMVLQKFLHNSVIVCVLTVATMLMINWFCQKRDIALYKWIMQ